MQEERLHKGSPQANRVFEFVCHKQLFAKKYNLGRTEQNIKLNVFEDESDLAG